MEWPADRDPRKSRCPYRKCHPERSRRDSEDRDIILVDDRDYQNAVVDSHLTALGWTAKMELHDGLRRTYEWYLGSGKAAQT